MEGNIKYEITEEVSSMVVADSVCDVSHLNKIEEVFLLANADVHVKQESPKLPSSELQIKLESPKMECEVKAEDDHIYIKQDSDPLADTSIQYKCTHCDKVLVTKNGFACHVLTHKAKKGPKNYICSYCSKVFQKCSDLERHIRIHTGEKPFGCDKCGKGFTLKSTLEYHYRTHNPSRNKDFSCTICSSYFSAKTSLRLYMLIHTGVKPYQCSLCPKKFRTSGHRKSHMATHLKKLE